MLKYIVKSSEDKNIYVSTDQSLNFDLKDK